MLPETGHLVLNISQRQDTNLKMLPEKGHQVVNAPTDRIMLPDNAMARDKQAMASDKHDHVHY